jgi:hypothetical protein
MRFILVDWDIGLCNSYPCSAETLYLFTNILDRSLLPSLYTPITASKFQFVGIACFLITLRYK